MGEENGRGTPTDDTCVVCGRLSTIIIERRAWCSRHGKLFTEQARRSRRPSSGDEGQDGDRRR